MRRSLVLVIVAMVLATFTAVPGSLPIRAANAADINEVIGDFESAEGWTLGLGPEFPGAQGDFSRDSGDATSGSSSGLLSADFTGGGTYVQVGRPLSLDAKALRFQVRTSDLSRVRLRMVDATGQVHQQRLAVAAGGEWQELTVSDFDSGDGYLHFGGANDGTWHAPAQRIALLVEKGDILDGAQTAQVRFDDVSVTATPPDLAFEQVAPGNIVEQPAQLEIGITSRGDTVSWSLRGFWGDEVAAGDTAMNDATTVLTLPVADPGYYRLVASATLGGEAIATRETTLALLAPFDAAGSSGSPFGLATHFSGAGWEDPGHETVALADLAGASTVREDAFWHSIESTKGEYGFDRFDGLVSDLDAAGITWLPIAAYNNQHHDGNATPYTDAGRQAFADYTVATMEHYAELPWVEVYNEFNGGFGDRGDGPADSRADYYFSLLKKTYDEVKASRPEVTVVGAATAGVPLPWLEELFALGGLEYMDVVSVHPYVYPADPEQAEQSLKDLDALIREYNGGQSKPIWITEQGWPTHTTARGVDEPTQAANVVRSHVLAFSHGVEKYFWYDLMNDGLDETVNEHNFGLIRHTTDPAGRWTPKPGYVSYATMTRQLTGTEYVGADDIDGVASHVFTKNGDQTRVIWAGAPTTIAVQTDEPVSVTDLTGATQEYQPAAGRVYLSVTGDPIYLTGNDVSLAATTKFSLTADGEGPATIGDPIDLTLTVDNTTAPRNPVRGTFTVAGTSVPVRVGPGQLATVPVSVPAQPDPGTRDLVGRLDVRGVPAARLSTQVDVVHPLSLRSKHVRVDGTDVLRAIVHNAAARDVTLEGLTWTAGDASGTAELPQALAPGESHVVDIPLSDLADGEHQRELRLSSSDYPDVTDAGDVILVPDADLRSSAQRAITVDGELDDLSGLTPVDLTTEGTVKVNDHGGPDDLGGQIWATWDADNFYLSARIDDDTHAQPGTDSEIWQGDSIQFGIAAGLPGETPDSYEYGVALTEDGPQVYRWSAVTGGVGPVPDARLEISRDETQQETVYELALPWSLLAPAEPGDGLLSLSLLLNENDGTSRAGWIEWGSGIGGAKDPALFKPMRLDAQP